jgi:hypothetical protein
VSCSILPAISRVLSAMMTSCKPGPVVAVLEPSDIMEWRVGPRFDAAVIAVNRLMAADVAILEAIDLLFGGKKLEDPRAACPVCL